MTNYDRYTSPEQNLARMVYGTPKPLLGPRQRRDDEFYGRLFDQLANAHACLVKICYTKHSAKDFASRLRPELPSDLYSVGIKQNADEPRDDEWMVLVYNRVTRSMAVPAWLRQPKPQSEWVDTEEAAKILGVSRSHVLVLINKYEIRHKIRGGRSEKLLHRDDLVILANRADKRTKKKE